LNNFLFTNDEKWQNKLSKMRNKNNLFIKQAIYDIKKYVNIVKITLVVDSKSFNHPKFVNDRLSPREL